MMLNIALLAFLLISATVLRQEAQPRLRHFVYRDGAAPRGATATAEQADLEIL
jgi:hypothetical protein